MYGTWPSTPSGTNFSVFPKSDWKYLSADPSAIAATEPIPLYDLNLLPWYKKISPGASSVPANREPIIATSAPAANAFAKSPENFMPPSAIIGTPDLCASFAQSTIAES